MALITLHCKEDLQPRDTRQTDRQTDGRRECITPSMGWTVAPRAQLQDFSLYDLYIIIIFCHILFANHSNLFHLPLAAEQKTENDERRIVCRCFDVPADTSTTNAPPLYAVLRQYIDISEHPAGQPPLSPPASYRH